MYPGRALHASRKADEVQSVSNRITCNNRSDPDCCIRLTIIRRHINTKIPFSGPRVHSNDLRLTFYDKIPGEEKSAIESYKQAIKIAEKNLEVNPNDVELISDIAAYYSDIGDTTQAIHLLNKATSLDNKNYDYYHWYIELMPRLTRIAGFEWGTGFYVQSTPPELAIKFLKEAKV